MKTQGRIDKVIVKNSDAVARLIKEKEENNEITRSLEMKIDILKENELKHMIIKTRFLQNGKRMQIVPP